ncbi:MAG: DUF4177 domain-containing protein [Anaerolineae bacterium]|nr:DUF4177 domain-containing protein [Anaerolineae bacterium]
MPQWEYLTTFVEANARPKEKREFLKRRFPGKNKHPRYTPESMMPELDQLGAEGWELIHMEPVAQVGGKGDILFKGSGSRWSHSYFCVFKRMKLEPVQSAPPPIAYPTAQQPAQPPAPAAPPPAETNTRETTETQQALTSNK